MFEQVWAQWLLIAFAALVLVGIKFYTVNKSYNNKLSHFVHPSQLLPDIRKKLQKVQGSDPRIILSQCLTQLSSDPNKMRNVAILVALMKQDRINIDPFVNRIKKQLNAINYEKTQRFVQQYRDFVMKEIEI